MSIIDVSTYDLHKLSDQQQIIKDIIDEQNRQFDQNSQAIGYQIVAYRKLSVTTVADLTPKTYTDTFVHGLGYAPITIVFRNEPTTEYSPTPDVGLPLATGPPFPANYNAYITVDKQNVVWNIKTDGTIGITIPIALYVINLPAQI